MEAKTIIIEGMTLKLGKISPVELMTVAQAGLGLYKKDPDSDTFVIDYSSMRSIETLNTFYTMVFEHTEVQIKDKWLPVKEKGREIWWPESIADNMDALISIVNWFMNDIIFPVFQKSSESKNPSGSLDQSKATTEAVKEKE